MLMEYGTSNKTITFGTSWDISTAFVQSDIYSSCDSPKAVIDLVRQPYGFSSTETELEALIDSDSDSDSDSYSDSDSDIESMTESDTDSEYAFV